MSRILVLDTWASMRCSPRRQGLVPTQAFATVAGVAAKQGRGVVSLMDRDCHNSMFTGAFYDKEAREYNFDHNDLGDWS